MRNLALVFGLCGAVTMTAFACGDDVTTTGNGGSGATGGSTGQGGATTTTTTTSSTTNDPCAGPFDHICAEACCKVENTCGFTGSCSLAGQLLGVDLDACTEMEATCVGTCLNDADCAQIASLATQNPDPTVGACLAACTGPCLGCAATECGAAIQMCTGDATCSAFVQCAAACPDMDGACITGCASNNPGALTDAVMACATQNCNTECGLAAGTGGGGGAGGAGGAGGN